MVKLWIPVFLAVFLCTSVVCVVDMRQRMNELERRPRIDPQELASVNAEIGRLTVQIQTSSRVLRELSGAQTHLSLIHI